MIVDDRQSGTDAPSLAFQLSQSRRTARRRFLIVTCALVVATMALMLADLMFGHELYRIDELWAVARGHEEPGLSFIIGRLRMPRVLTGTLCGIAFGMAGSAFQQLLGNMLASPDIIGITAGANTAAVFGIILLGWSGLPLAGLAVIGGLITAVTVLSLSWRGAFSPTRLILIGIGTAAALNAVSSWMLVKADQWDIQTASRWLTGSLAAANQTGTTPLALCVVGVGAALLTMERHLDALRLGVPMARGLGVRTNMVQALTVVLAVFLLAVATAASGPISFVSFLAGPIARLLTGPSRPGLLQAGLTGACLVLFADILAQHIPPTQLPVGVVTSIIGGPALVLLMIRGARTKGAQ